MTDDENKDKFLIPYGVGGGSERDWHGSQHGRAHPSPCVRRSESVEGCERLSSNVTADRSTGCANTKAWPTLPSVRHRATTAAQRGNHNGNHEREGASCVRGAGLDRAR